MKKKKLIWKEHNRRKVAVSNDAQTLQASERASKPTSSVMFSVPSNHFIFFLVVHFTALSGALTEQFQMMRWFMNDDSERVWKKAVVV